VIKRGFGLQSPSMKTQQWQQNPSDDEYDFASGTISPQLESQQPVKRIPQVPKSKRVKKLKKKSKVLFKGNIATMLGNQFHPRGGPQHMGPALNRRMPLGPGNKPGAQHTENLEY